MILVGIGKAESGETVYGREYIPLYTGQAYFDRIKVQKEAKFFRVLFKLSNPLFRLAVLFLSLGSARLLSSRRVELVGFNDSLDVPAADVSAILSCIHSLQLHLAPVWVPLAQGNNPFIKEWNTLASAPFVRSRRPALQRFHIAWIK